MIVSTLFVLFISVFSGINCTRTDKNVDPYLRPTLRALRFALEFLENEHKNVNLDAIIGTRIVEGQLKVLLRRIGEKYPNLKIPQDVLGEINELRLLAGQISDTALPYLAARDTRYFLRIGYTLTKNFWDLDYDSKDVNADVQIWPYSNREAITEKTSDDCLTEFFGTG
ncbi:hypothetical protein LOTGIDRAFT_154673 [Lottia gigantea]|uniref:Uncharacterized protein n=1 Tax=Lottia gigantea TaxID=225164 RepID=V4A1K0_LOTGI|nr:hypothetical protein LOTGIDRAFT_154673 [Lottia gigantea]ESO87171.1 hypothetical protein LOTGIDRAFT_154673 [Lottia gigantea]